MSHALRTTSARKLEVLDARCCLRGVPENWGAVTADDVCAERKKRGRISCPSRNDHRGPLRLLLSDCNYFRATNCTLTRTAVTSSMTAGKRALARNLKRRWCFGSPAFVPLLWEIRGFAALPRDRCASSFSQFSGRKLFYTWAILNWRRLNLFRTSGRKPHFAKRGTPGTVAVAMPLAAGTCRRCSSIGAVDTATRTNQ